MTLQDDALRTVTIWVRLEFDGVIRTIPLSVVDRDDGHKEIRLDGHTIGFTRRADRIFVALTGTRLDQAEECGQCLSWDQAAAMLVTTSGRLPKPEPE